MKGLKRKKDISVKVPVDLDRRRYFTLNLAAVIRWESNTGKPFFSNETWENFTNPADMALMLWACLVEDDPNLKPEDIIQMFENKQITPEAVMPAFIRSLSAAWGSQITELIGGK